MLWIDGRSTGLDSEEINPENGLRGLRRVVQYLLIIVADRCFLFSDTTVRSKRYVITILAYWTQILPLTVLSFYHDSWETRSIRRSETQGIRTRQELAFGPGAERWIDQRESLQRLVYAGC